jgi:YceI-like domain
MEPFDLNLERGLAVSERGRPPSAPTGSHSLAQRFRPRCKQTRRMRTVRLGRRAQAFGLVACLWPTLLVGQTRAIDAGRSVLIIHVLKSGLFSGFAHNHEIAAPIAEGAADFAQRSRVSLRVDARRMRVLDPGTSDNTRSEIQRTMQGSAVLDVERFPEISFQSKSIDAAGHDHWLVHGNLTLHGQTMPITADVLLKDGHYRGTATLKQREFGMTPVSVAGGTIKVKDELKVEFDIVLAQ